LSCLIILDTLYRRYLSRPTFPPHTLIPNTMIRYTRRSPVHALFLHQLFCLPLYPLILCLHAHINYLMQFVKLSSLLLLRCLQLPHQLFFNLLKLLDLVLSERHLTSLLVDSLLVIILTSQYLVLFIHHYFSLSLKFFLLNLLLLNLIPRYDLILDLLLYRVELSRLLFLFLCFFPCSLLLKCKNLLFILAHHRSTSFIL